MKKIIVLLLLVVSVLSFSGCGDSGYSVDGIDCSVNPVSMVDDSTGGWKVVTIAQSGISAEDYAYNYYKTCFEAGDTIHWIVNFSTNTTSSISVIGSDVYVGVREYVDDEEHSAKDIGSGMLYGEWLMDPETGAMEKIQ